MRIVILVIKITNMGIALYVHIPFCVQKCRYCDFVSYNYSPDLAQAYLKALEQEMLFYASSELVSNKKINTVFIGGGTPTVLATVELERLLVILKTYFSWSKETEVTVEANPGTLCKQKLTVLKNAGVNRLSLGVQACQSNLLALLGRVHNYDQAVQAVEWARQAGFDNLNLDLIFAIPHQTIKEWQESLTLLADLQPEHLSCYDLQLEDNTPLSVAVEQGKLLACSEESALAMYQETIAFLTGKGYSHYEISNFSKPGYQSEHNLCYWHNKQYLGLGLAAHSYINSTRWANTGNLEQYITKVSKEFLPVDERHQLTTSEMMSETVFMGLRLINGLQLDDFSSRFNCRVTDVWSEQINKLMKQGLLAMTATHLKLTKKGLPLANVVFREFV